MAAMAAGLLAILLAWAGLSAVQPVGAAGSPVAPGPEPPPSSAVDGRSRSDTGASVAATPAPWVADEAIAKPLDDNTVVVDLRIANIFGFSARDKTFSVQGVIWLHYNQSLLNKLQAAGRRPIEMLDLYNRINPWNSAITPLGDPVISDQGQVSQGYSFDGLFYSDRLDYLAYPFGGLHLPVILQPRPGVVFSTSSPIRFVPGRSEVGSRVGIDGYELSDWSFRTIPRSSRNEIGAFVHPNLSRLQFQISYRANLAAALVKWILPLVVVMSIILLAPFIPNGLGGDRLAVAPTILLTIVFMQQSYRDGLPSLPYLTFMDSLYSYSFVVTLAFFGLFIWASNLDADLQRTSKPYLDRRISRTSRIMQVVSLSGYAVLVLGFLPRL